MDATPTVATTLGEPLLSEATLFFPCLVTSREGYKNRLVNTLYPFWAVRATLFQRLPRGSVYAKASLAILSCDDFGWTCPPLAYQQADHSQIIQHTSAPYGILPCDSVG